MSRPLSPAIGGILVFLGLLWTGQGVGWIGGSFMTGATTWAVIGPVVALTGAVLLVRGIRTPGPGA